MEQLRITQSELVSRVVIAECQQNLSAELEQQIVDFLQVLTTAITENTGVSVTAIEELTIIYDYFVEVLVRHGVQHTAVPQII